MRYAIALVAISLTAAALAAGGFGSMADDGPAPQTGAVSSQAPLRIESCLSPADLREEVGELVVLASLSGQRDGPSCCCCCEYRMMARGSPPATAGWCNLEAEDAL